ncbi:MAG TPA: ATP-binding protein [Pseudonocardiaceae bacterium]|jgi:anti-sigma regulatory factor (Ser/Thr protein kinase)|nr:ATP-binding protein [Pseudonocardiaceae bacterium]
MHPDGGSGHDSHVAVNDLDWATTPARAESLPGLRRVVADWARHTSLDATQVDDLVLSLDEAAANVVEHAYSRRRGGVLAVLARSLDGPARVEVTVTDHGRWQPAPNDSGSRGWGIGLIRRLADDVEIRSSDFGTIVRMTWTVPAC